MLPLPPNTTCDIYRAGSAPPAAPSVAGVPCHLTSAFARGLETGEGDARATYRFSHILLVDVSVDIRDDFDTGTIGANFDTVYIPDKNGTAFRVRFVERRLRGTDKDHKKVYLARETPSWPTTDL